MWERTLVYAHDHFIMRCISRVLLAEMRPKVVQPIPDGLTSWYSTVMLEARMVISDMLHKSGLEVRDVAAFQAKC
jgi:hypothetical protein